MTDINKWLEDIVLKLRNTFNDNLLFAGYQGSYARNEATENSDIDMVVILNHLQINDLNQYRQILQTMPDKEKACGFICGKKELQNWSKNELFQLFYDTKPIHGKLNELIPVPDRRDAGLAAKIGAQNIYHMSCHSFLYSNSQPDILRQLYKEIVFVIKAKHFYETGKYLLTTSELLTDCIGTEQDILNISINRKRPETFSFEDKINRAFRLLIEYCSELIKSY